MGHLLQRPSKHPSMRPDPPPRATPTRPPLCSLLALKEELFSAATSLSGRSGSGAYASGGSAQGSLSGGSSPRAPVPLFC